VKATLTSKGQITIPLAIRKRLGLKAGHVLEFDEQAPYLKATHPITQGAWESLHQAVETLAKDHPWEQLDTAGLLDEMRGEVDLPPEKS
jgi:AbrB family looped-hinge helix DNA binding protein